MSDIAVTVTNPGSAAVTIGTGGSVSATVSSGGSVAVNLPGGEAAWANITGKPTTFTPAAHTHVAADITDRATALVTSVNGQTGAVTISGGGGGASLSDATPQALGTASAGTSSSASRADHVHALPALVASLNTLTGPLTLAAGTGVTITPSGSTLTIASTASASLSDALPLALGTAAAGDDTQAARGDHSHPMPTAADIGALDVDATVDGGDYVGVIIEPGGSITISSQPSSQTVTAGGVNEVQSTLPDGTWRGVSYADGKWFVMGFSNTSADYYAVSTDGGVSWTKRYGLPSAGLWSAMQFQNSVYATNAAHTTAYSSDGLAWSAYTSTSGFATSAVLGAGGKFLRFANGGINYSTDAASWTKSLDWSGSGSTHFGYAGNTFFASIFGTGIRASVDGVTWGSAYALGSSTGVSPQAYGDFLTPSEFGGSLYFSRQNHAPLKYTSGAWEGVPSPTTGGGQVASDGSVLVLYSYTGSVYSSTNGTTWVQRLTGLGSQNTRTLFYAGGRFVLLHRYGSGSSTPGTAYHTSTNGIEWTAATRTYGTANAVNAGTVSGSTHASHQSGIFSAITFGGTTASATFGVVATYTSPLSYQWQLSTDGGSTWSNVTDATASTLVLTGLTSADTGKKYRCVLSATGTTSVNTNAATLTVN